jgi:hypothetical protein
MKKLGVGEMGTWISARMRPVHRRAWAELQPGRTTAMAENPEREIEEMEERSERLEEEIEDVREDWERKKADPSVPGAAGDPEKAEEGPQPETSYPSKGDAD